MSWEVALLPSDAMVGVRRVELIRLRAAGPSPLLCRYEGTYEVNALVAGRGATGLAAFKPPPARKARQH